MCRESPDIFVQVGFKPLGVLCGSSRLESVFQTERVPAGHGGTGWQQWGCPQSTKSFISSSWEHLPHISDWLKWRCYPKTASSMEGKVLSCGREVWVLSPSILSERGCSSGVQGLGECGGGSLLRGHPTECRVWGNVGRTSAGGSSPQ